MEIFKYLLFEFFIPYLYQQVLRLQKIEFSERDVNLAVQL